MTTETRFEIKELKNSFVLADPKAFAARWNFNTAAPSMKRVLWGMEMQAPLYYVVGETDSTTYRGFVFEEGGRPRRFVMKSDAERYSK